MKLTNKLREAFVNAVMADVPQIDYNDQASKIIEAQTLNLLPVALKEALAKDPSILSLIERHYVGAPVGLRGQYTHAPSGFDLSRSAPKAWAELKKLGEKNMAQSDAHDRLKSQIKGAAASVSTVKALHALLPEFAKYLPDDTPTTKNLPALANVVSEFVQAGWPKGGK